MKNKRMLTKTVSILTVGVMCVSAAFLAGCGSKENASEEAANAAEAVQNAAAEMTEGTDSEGSIADGINNAIGEFAESAAGLEPITPVPVTVTPTPEPTPEPEPVSVNFLCVGDNLIHSSLIQCGLGMGGDWNYMYDPIRGYIEEADVATINQETMLVDDPNEYGGYPQFGTPYGVGDATINAGFDVFTCATNHSLDKGGYGIDCTVAYYESHGMPYTGIQNSATASYDIPYTIIERNGIRFALLNFTYDTNGYPFPDGCPYMVHTFDDEAQIRADLAAADADSDCIIVFAHWGDEYSQYVNDFQFYWANVFYECGVNVVVGGHPHVVEPYEMKTDGAGHDMLVYYSLGNFVSNQTDVEDLVGGMARFTITKTGDKVAVTAYSMDPVATHTTGELYSQAYMLADYSQDLCDQNLYVGSVDQLWNIYNDYTTWQQ